MWAFEEFCGDGFCFVLFFIDIFCNDGIFIMSLVESTLSSPRTVGGFFSSGNTTPRSPRSVGALFRTPSSVSIEQNTLNTYTTEDRNQVRNTINLAFDTNDYDEFKYCVDLLRGTGMSMDQIKQITNEDCLSLCQLSMHKSFTSAFIE